MRNRLADERGDRGIEIYLTHKGIRYARLASIRPADNEGHARTALPSTVFTAAPWAGGIMSALFLNGPFPISIKKHRPVV